MNLVLRFRWLYSIVAVLFPNNKKKKLKKLDPTHSCFIFQIFCKHLLIRIWPHALSLQLILFHILAKFLILVYTSQSLPQVFIAIFVIINSYSSTFNPKKIMTKDSDSIALLLLVFYLVGINPLFKLKKGKISSSVSVTSHHFHDFIPK